METLSMLYLGFAWMFGGFINGVTSIGGNLVGVPLSMLVMDAKTVVVFGCMTGLFVNGTVSMLYHKAIPWAEFFLLASGCVAGAPLGLMLLHIVPVSTLLLATSGVLIAFLAWQFFSRRMSKSFTCPSWAALPVGIVTGMLFASTSMAGPVLALYAFMRKWTKEMTLATPNLIATANYLYATALQWNDGLCTPVMWHALCYTAPGAIFGVLLSVPLLRRVDAQLFRRLLLSMVACSAAIMFYRGITG